MDRIVLSSTYQFPMVQLFLCLIVASADHRYSKIYSFVHEERYYILCSIINNISRESGCSPIKWLNLASDLLSRVGRPLKLFMERDNNVPLTAFITEGILASLVSLVNHIVES